MLHGEEHVLRIGSVVVFVGRVVDYIEGRLVEAGRVSGPGWTRIFIELRVGVIDFLVIGGIGGVWEQRIGKPFVIRVDRPVIEVVVASCVGSIKVGSSPGGIRGHLVVFRSLPSVTCSDAGEGGAVDDEVGAGMDEVVEVGCGTG